jgi:FKBP-type peptidyl-prolyl cis-trans isomerase SlyD
MKTQVISFHCVLKNSLGQVISSSFNRDVINHGQGQDSLWDLVRGLEGVSAGEKRRIEIQAKRAYGLYDPQLRAELPHDELRRGSSLRVGDEVRMKSIDSDEMRVFRVIATSSDTVTLDGNHPLAGQDLVFDIDVTAVRELREDDEIEALPVPHAKRLH